MSSSLFYKSNGEVNWNKNVRYGADDLSHQVYRNCDATSDGSLEFPPKVADERHILAERFKTKLCKSYLENKVCRYEDRCMFAHGEHELRTADMNLRDSLFTEEAIKAYQRALRLIYRAHGTLDNACTRSQASPELYGRVPPPNYSSSEIYTDGDARTDYFEKNSLNEEVPADASSTLSDCSGDSAHRRSLNQRRRYRNRSMKRGNGGTALTNLRGSASNSSVDSMSWNACSEVSEEMLDVETHSISSRSETFDTMVVCKPQHSRSYFSEPTGVYHHNPYSFECSFVECGSPKSPVITISKDSALLYAP